MSEISVKVAREHAPKVWRSSGTVECLCGAQFPTVASAYTYHLTEVTEAAVRETIAADISRMGVAIRYPDCEIPLEPSTVRDIAARIARGQQ